MTDLKGLLWVLFLVWSFNFCSSAMPHSTLVNEVKRFSESLHKIVNDDLKYREIADIYANSSNFNYTVTVTNGTEEVQRLAADVSQNIMTVSQILESNSQEVKKAYQANTLVLNAQDCCQRLFNTVNSKRFGMEIDELQVCLSQYSSLNPQPQPVDMSTVQPVFQANLANFPGLRWQYMGDKDGNYYQFPAADRHCSQVSVASNDFRFQNWYVGTASPKKKNIVMVIDESSSMDGKTNQYVVPKGTTKICRDLTPAKVIKYGCPIRMHAAKMAAYTILDTLSAKDWTGVVAFSDKARSPEGCFGDKIAQAHKTNKKTFRQFVNDIKPLTGRTTMNTVYQSGLSDAFEMMYQASLSAPRQFDDSMDLILFLTDGDPNDSTDLIRKTIYDGNQLMNKSVSIFMYVIGSTQKLPSMLSYPDQNNQKLQYRVPGFRGTFTTENAQIWQGYTQPTGPPGYFEIIRDRDAHMLREKMGGYYLNYNHSTTSEPTFNLPYTNRRNEMLVTVTKPIFRASSLLGVIGLDVTADSLFKSVSDFRVGQFSHAFLVNKDGKVLTHRNYPKPDFASTELNFIDVGLAEPSLSKQAIDNIKKGISGSEQAEVDIAVGRGVSQQDGAFSVQLNATYFYEPVANSSYTVVLVLFDTDESSVSRSPTPVNPLSPISTASQTSTCTCTCNKPLNVCLDGNIVRYLNGTIRASIANSNGSGDALVIGGYSKKTWTTPPKYLQYRYAGLANEMFAISPGHDMPTGFLPTEQPWYKQASISEKGLVVTRPGYGASGVKTAVTTSRSLLDHGKALVGVLAGDLETNVLNYLMTSTVPECLSSQYRCTLLDHSGYSVLHPPVQNGRELIHDHATIIEPEISALMLAQHVSTIKPIWCRQLHGLKTSQMFYSIEQKVAYLSNTDNTSQACTDYGLYRLPDTNLHLLVSDASPCAAAAAASACHCNATCNTCGLTTNKLCQCPCQCVLGSDDCANTFNLTFPAIPCPAPWYSLDPIVQNVTNVTIPDCPTPCYTRQNETDCASSGGGCSWCNSSSTTGVCLDDCNILQTTTPGPATTTALPPSTTNACPNTKLKSISVLVDAFVIKPKTCGVSLEQFCTNQCPSVTPGPCTSGQDSSNLGVALGVPLGIMSALAAGALLALLMKKPVTAPVPEIQKITPVESFNPNIYRASMGDILLNTTGKQGAQLDGWNGAGEGMFGRLTPPN